jgi:hypothetical protein
MVWRGLFLLSFVAADYRKTLAVHYGTVNLSYALIITRSINSQKRARLSFRLSEFVRWNPEKKGFTKSGSHVGAAAGVLSLIFRIYLVYQIGFVGGLFR